MLTTGKIHGMSLTIAATLATVAFFQTGQASADPLGFASPFNFTRSDEMVFAPAMRQMPQSRGIHLVRREGNRAQGRVA